ncbi:hypothetical protein [Parasitella parasitica]|uniref:Uncharacterized protein n=1 Tax=Parasitella parasitica TaxID=35722 RepID=A0A0B7NJI3_9FUNG|nr:hypothetical protein [Parasitella parasitica]
MWPFFVLQQACSETKDIIIANVLLGSVLMMMDTSITNSFAEMLVFAHCHVSHQVPILGPVCLDLAQITHNEANGCFYST